MCMQAAVPITHKGAKSCGDGLHRYADGKRNSRLSVNAVGDVGIQ